jgi:phosphate transport system substrate-binding protein
MYVSGILFLVLWNKTKSKLVYLLFVVPVACIGIEIGIDKYSSYIKKIPVVYEGFNLNNYEPFRENNLLPDLGETSSFKITENLPILDGATAFYPVYAAFVQAVYPKNIYRHWEVPVLCNRTPNAYDNLLEGKIDIIFCLEPSEMQMQQFYNNNNNIKLVPIGREAFVFFVNSRNQVNNVTLEDIQGIYSGRIKNWIKLNGSNKNIIY